MTPPWSVVDNQPHQLGIRIIILCCLPLLQNTMLIMIIGLQYARPSRISMKRPRSSMDRNPIKYSSNANAIPNPSRIRESHLLADIDDIYQWHGDLNNAILAYQMVKLLEITVWSHLKPLEDQHGGQKRMLRTSKGRGLIGCDQVLTKAVQLEHSLDQQKYLPDTYAA